MDGYVDRCRHMFQLKGVSPAVISSPNARPRAVWAPIQAERDASALKVVQALLRRMDVARAPFKTISAFGGLHRVLVQKLLGCIEIKRFDHGSHERRKGVES